MHLLVVNEICDASETHLVRSLAAQGHQVSLFHDPRDERGELFKSWGIRAMPLRFKNRFDFIGVHKIRKFLNENSVDVIYAPTGRGVSACLFATRGLSTRVVAYRGTIGHLSKLDPASRFAHLNKKLAFTICNCDAVLEYLIEKGVPASRLAKVYKGHALDWYPLHDYVPTREQLKVPEGAFLVGFVANFRPVKGLDVVLAAANRLDDSFHFLLIGEIRDKKILHSAEYLRVADRVHLLGYQKNALDSLRACDISIMPSISREGVPRALVQSILLSIPVVASRVGGIPEAVEHEKTGLLVEPRNDEDLANALKIAKDNPGQMREYAERGIALVEKRFEASLYVTEMLKVFEKVSRDSRVYSFPKKERLAKVSALIVCCNEEKVIRRAIESVAWCDEIVIIDSGSTDRTLEICKEYTSKIVNQPWLGFVEQKRFGITQCSHEWILNIDSDEEVTPELRNSVEEVLSLPDGKRNQYAGYDVCRVVRYLGRWWNRGGWHPEYRLRLIKRELSDWGGINPHERAVVDGPVSRIKGELRHFSFSTINEHVDSSNRHSTYSAVHVEEASVAKMIVNPIARFLKFYFIRKGFLEGRAGFVAAACEGFYTFLKYAKAWERLHVVYDDPSEETEQEKRQSNG